MSSLLVLGGASNDTLHLEERTVTSAGGAGMYTAMAAVRAGAVVSMFTVRPDPCPESLQPVKASLAEWMGPIISPEALPRFEISYRGGETRYLELYFGAEASLTPAMLPADLSRYGAVHAIPIGGTLKQLGFVRACRERGARLISAGTWPGDAVDHPDRVRAVMAASDIFFMNEVEAKGVFGSLGAVTTPPGRLLFITLGAEGALVIQGEVVTEIPAVPAVVLDPTGAGDTFCGSTLAYLLAGQHPVMAARQAVALSAEMIQHVGPAALLSRQPAPRMPADARVQINQRQVERVAQVVGTLAEVVAYDFVSPYLPPVAHPKTVDYFFASTLQQFSFWSAKSGKYHRPLIDTMGGQRLKGSDYLWEAYRRWLDRDADCLSPERQARLSRRELEEVFRSDDGAAPMPAIDLHLAQARQYGRDMMALKLTPQAIVDKAASSSRPLLTFLQLLDHIGGYKEDPLRKKSNLLALILNQRPERFLPFGEQEGPDAVIDYHLSRISLRLGLIDVVDGDLQRKLAERRVISAAEEWAVRYPTYQAIDRVGTLSGKGNGAVDAFAFFNARTRCVEMDEPACHSCPLDPVCAHRRELFQPVLRTTFY